MSEYDLVCDVCAAALEPRDAAVTWIADGSGEHDFTLAHVACAPANATDSREVRRIVAPNGYLEFVSERIGRRNDDPEGLRTILWALAPFVMRPDNPSEMDTMRAHSFGAEVGVKYGTPPDAKGPVKEPPEGGK